MIHSIQRSLTFGIVAFLVTAPQLAAEAEAPLPVGSNPVALGTPHFPDRLHTFVWRNWQLVEPDRLAKVVGASTDKIVAIATSMGLPPTQQIQPQMRKRGYITIVRRNWSLLPYDQLLQLLDMSAEELAFSLKEDDFLFIKLGSLKPKCEPLRYREPTPEARERAGEIKRLVQHHFGDQLSQPAEPRFHFVKQFARTGAKKETSSNPSGQAQQELRLVYSYFGSFGDPLNDSTADPYPEGLLAKLAEVGVNGVWMHVVLRQLAPGGETFPEFGVGHQQQITNLRRLVKQTKKHGIGVYLYMNEPRAMPPEFFKRRPEMGGIPTRGLVTMCTSDPRVRHWMTDSLASLFRQVPDLAGVFTITASENPTNCAYSRGQSACPRCRNRSQAEIVAEVNAAIESGVHQGNPDARVIVWDWGWNGHGDATDIINILPKKVELMSVSEWALPLERGGVRGHVGEYSMSAVGPGPRAKRHWALAKQRGLKTVAKVQFNNTWELSSLPFLPVLDLIAEHCENLRASHVDGQMLSWTLGGYPSPNLQVAHRFATQPDATRETVLDSIAKERYGAGAAPHVRRAWTAFSKGFRQFPYDGRVMYQAPQQVGPANLLYPEPTGYRATMVCFPYDDLNGWRGPYPANVLAEQFEKMAAHWAIGLEHFEQGLQASPNEKRATAEADFGLARAAQLHFASVGNQIRFVLARDALRQPDLSQTEEQKLRQQMRKTIDREIILACELFTLAQRDSRIGFEASNHYFYVPLDLAEKVINCDYLKQNLAGQN